MSVNKPTSVDKGAVFTQVQCAYQIKCAFESQRHSTVTINSEPSKVRHSAASTFNMFKLLGLSCLLAGCLAGAFDFPTWLREAGKHWRPPRGCADRAAGWAACARLNDTAALAPHPYDCRLFYYCNSAGFRPICRGCPFGLLFNPELQVCDWPDNVNCTETRPPRPPRPTRPGHNATTPIPATTTDANATAPWPSSTAAPATRSPSTTEPSSISTDPTTGPSSTSGADGTTETLITTRPPGV